MKSPKPIYDRISADENMLADAIRGAGFGKDALDFCEAMTRMGLAQHLGRGVFAWDAKALKKLDYLKLVRLYQTVKARTGY